MWWKLHDRNFNRFWLIHPCDGRTDGRTDRQTDGRNCRSIYALPAMLSRVIKMLQKCVILHCESKKTRQQTYISENNAPSHRERYVSDISILQGSVVMPLRCGGICSDLFIKNFQMNVTMKEFWKWGSTWQSYEQAFGVLCFLTHSVMLKLLQVFYNSF